MCGVHMIHVCIGCVYGSVHSSCVCYICMHVRCMYMVYANGVCVHRTYVCMVHVYVRYMYMWFMCMIYVCEHTGYVCTECVCVCDESH